MNHSPTITRQDEGYFAPDSMARRINREAIVLLGGGCAVLLQLAHPYVTAGVDDHSHYQKDTLGRLFRTMDFVDTLVFADRATVDRALAHFHAMHEQIRGSLGERAGHMPAEAPYSGIDPHAKMWVHATLVDTGLRTYEHFIGPLDDAQRQRYYQDSLTLARLLDIPDDLLPPTWEAFRNYMEEMLSGNTLAVTGTTRRLAQAVLHPKHVGFWPAQSFRLVRLVTTGLLPPPFRLAYGLPWSRGHQALFRAVTGIYRLTRPYLPGWFWKAPLQGGRLPAWLIFASRGRMERDREEINVR